MYIGNILLIYRTKCTLSRTKILAQNKSDKIVFLSHAFYFVEPIIVLVHRKYPYIRTNSRTKKHTQNKSDISDLYIGQIRRLEKNYTFCEMFFELI